MIRLIPEPQKIEYSSGNCLNPEKICCINNEKLLKEEYVLRVEKEGIFIEFSSLNGRFYAEKTLEQLKLCTAGNLPCIKICDKPRFEYRGFMIDCARHYFTVSELKKLINALSYYKLNRFHWHLSDDQGFRIELSGFKDAYEKGSVRRHDNFGKMCSNNKPYSGFYTKQEIKDIVDFCAERFIEVVPEFDIPGHSSAVLHAYPHLSCSGKPVEVKDTNGIFSDVYCVGKEETKDFLFKITDEIAEMFPYGYFHLGGDEVPKNNWKNCPACREKMLELNTKNADDLRAYIINTVAENLIKKGKRVIVWNDCLSSGALNKNIIAERWLDRKNLSITAANNGRGLIMAPFDPYYCDYPYGMHNLKKVYKFEPLAFKKLNAEGRKNILGVESPVWTEFIDNNERLEYLCFPRWLAVAETAWADPEKKDYGKFFTAAKRECKRLKSEDINSAPEYEYNISGIKAFTQTASFFAGFKKKNK